MFASLRRRRDLTPVSNVCETAPKYLFSAPKGLNQLPEAFRISSQPEWQMAFLTGQSWCILKSWYTGEDLEQEFRRCFADGHNPKFCFVCGAG